MGKRAIFEVKVSVREVALASKRPVSSMYYLKKHHPSQYKLMEQGMVWRKIKEAV